MYCTFMLGLKIVNHNKEQGDKNGMIRLTELNHGTLLKVKTLEKQASGTNTQVSHKEKQAESINIRNHSTRGGTITRA